MSLNSNAVILNIYDLSDINECFWHIGFGGYHSTIEIYNEEYSYGPVHGIFAKYINHEHNLPLRQSIIIGSTDKSHSEIRDILNNMMLDYNGDAYHPIKMNCNHFTDDLCMILLNKSIPKYVNRFTLLCSCMRYIIPDNMDYKNREGNILLNMSPYIKNSLTDDNLLDNEIV